MSCDITGIAERLQAARKTKGLSQRELSELAGVPQAQISRIEAGAVDLRLSSLAALAHALDLELALVPRKAVAVVRSLSRDAISSNRKDVVAIQKEMQRISETMRGIQMKHARPRRTSATSEVYLRLAPVPSIDARPRGNEKTASHN